MYPQKRRGMKPDDRRLLRGPHAPPATKVASPRVGGGLVFRSVVVFDRGHGSEAEMGVTKQALNEFLNEWCRPAAMEQVAVIASDREAELVLSFTPVRTESGTIKAAINGIRCGVGSDYLPAAELVCRILGPSNPVIPHVLWLSDGRGDNADAAAALLRSDSCLVQTVGVATRTDETNEPVLRHLASSRGGRKLYYPLDRFSDRAGRLMAMLTACSPQRMPDFPGEPPANWR